MSRRWIPVLIFWAIFLPALLFSGRYPWLKPVWTAALLLLGGASAVSFLVQVLRHRGDPRALTSCGSKRWWLRLVLDEEKQPTQQP